MADGRYWLLHDAKDVDDTIDEVQAARGSEESLSARLAAIVGDFEADQQRQEAEIGTLLDRDAKNIFNSNLIPQTATRNGVTIGRTEKGLHISGTASSTSDTQIASFVLEIPGDDYHVYINTAASALNIWCSYRKSGASSDTYAPAVRDTLNTGDILKYLYFKSLPGGTTFDVDVDIMVCTAADYDISSQFVPFAPTNRELTVENASQQSEINYAVNTGAKNLLDYTFSINGNTSSRTNNGVTFTINPDRSISTSGTASVNITAAWIQMNYIVPSDPVILSGCPAGGSDTKYRIDILDGTKTGSVVAADYGNGVVIKSSMFTDGIGLIRIRIVNGTNVDGLVFKPMIRRAEITDDTYVPYAPTNRELYEMILALQSGRSVQSSAASLMQAGRIDAEMTDVQEVTENDT